MELVTNCDQFHVILIIWNWSQFVTSPYYYSNIAKSPKIYDYGFADYPKQDF